MSSRQRIIEVLCANSSESHRAIFALDQVLMLVYDEELRGKIKKIREREVIRAEEYQIAAINIVYD